MGIPDELFQSYSSCINDDSAFLRSESTSPLFSFIAIQFEPCLLSDLVENKE